MFFERTSFIGLQFHRGKFLLFIATGLKNRGQILQFLTPPCAKFRERWSKCLSQFSLSPNLL